MRKKTTIVLFSVCLLLITTISLVVFNLVYDAGHIYVGRIEIESKDQYRAFLDAISVVGVTVDALYIQNGGKDILIHIEELRIDDSKVPVVLVFVLRSRNHQVVNLDGVTKSYDEAGNLCDDTRELHDKLVYSVCMSMGGYGLTIGTWISRNGIYEVKKITQSTRKAI